MCNKLIIKDPTTLCVLCEYFGYQKIVALTKWRKQLGMKDSNCHVRFNHLKIVVGKATVWRYLINWQKYFHSSILHNPQNDRWYASASSTSQETAFAHHHRHAVHLYAYNSGKLVFTGRFSDKFVIIGLWILKILPHYTTLWFIVNHDTGLRMSLVFGH